MCGITGWVDWKRDLRTEEPLLQKMTDTLACRGPDARGVWLSPRAALGHRRLSVIDPARGAQPMTRRKGSHVCTITYNGELYNTDELRTELERRGHTFSTTCDTEVVLTAYIEWGQACVYRFNGIFAFAIWDDAEQSLFLARDRLGVKPLFYSQLPSGFLFGSEPKALLAHPAVPPEVDMEGLAEVLVLGPARTPGHGVYRRMAELKPGHSLTVTPRGLRTRRYWALESREHTDDAETTAEKVKHLVEDAVRRQLVSDVPLCTLLSGGLDSSALTAFAVKHFEESGRGKLHTYSVDYVDNDRYFRPDHFQPNSDSYWVHRVADYLSTCHHNVVLDTPQLIEALRHGVRARDLPGMADIDTSLYLFCRSIKEEFTVALSGEGADEIFGGYPWFRDPEALAADTFPWARLTEKRLSFLSPAVIESMEATDYLTERYRQALAEVPPLPGEDRAHARLREISYLSITRFMPTLLDRKDRMSMAVGLEVRVPFCDHRLVEYVWNLPWSLKAWGGQEKGILRHALRGVLPEAVLHRRKSPYPKTHNPAYAEAVQKALLDVLSDPTSPLRPLVNAAALREVARQGVDSFAVPWFGQLMKGPQLFAYLLQVEYWLRDYRVVIV